LTCQQKPQLKTAFEALPTDEMKALFLFTATRVAQERILALNSGKIDFKHML
jgi:hypothetical protein